MNELQPFNDILRDQTGVEFSDLKILRQALTHDSVVDQGQAFERLEFLGDGCLEMLIADLLFSMTDFDEGRMSTFRSTLTRKESLASILRSWKVEAYFRVGGAMDINHLPDSIYADFFESTLGALYKDRGFEPLRHAVAKVFTPIIEKHRHRQSFANPKTRLQEWTMARRLPLPQYQLVSQKGPPHAPVYTIEVLVDGQSHEAKGGSIKSAEHDAASKALQKLATI